MEEQWEGWEAQEAHLAVAQEGHGAEARLGEEAQAVAARAVGALVVVLEEVCCCSGHWDLNLGTNKCYVVLVAPADSPSEGPVLAVEATLGVEAVEHSEWVLQRYTDDNGFWNCQTLQLLLSCMWTWRKLDQELLGRPGFQPSSCLEFDCPHIVLEWNPPDLCLPTVVVQ